MRPVRILNGRFHALTREESAKAVMDLVEAGRRGYLCTVNVAILMTMRRDGWLQRFVDGAAITVADGVPLVIVDPPRTGMEKDALATLTDLAPTRIVYVSCDPATLARDVSRMASAGYRLREAQPVDLFPQTYHIECVAVLDLV